MTTPSPFEPFAQIHRDVFSSERVARAESHFLDRHGVRPIAPSEIAQRTADFYASRSVDDNDEPLCN